MEATRNLEQDEPTKNQLNRLTEDDNFDTDKIHNIHDAQSEVRDLIDNSKGFFTKNDRERFNRQLEQINSSGGDTDLKKVLEFKQEIEDKLIWVKDKTPKYESKLREKKEYFQDGAVDEYIDAFNKASIDGGDIASESRETIGKMERWERLEAELQEQIRVFKEFVAIFGENKELLRTLGKSEKQKRIKEYNKSKKNIEACRTLLEKNADLFSEEEREEINDEIEDSIGKSQYNLLRDLESKIKVRKNAAKTFKSLPKEYQTLCGNFAKLSAAEKQQALEKVETKMKEDYRKKQAEHPNSKDISEKSRTSFTA